MKDTSSARHPIKQILIIDDEPIDQKMYQRIIERSGLVQSVKSFTYAEKALDYLKQSSSPRPDVIFLDINMPRMNGFEFLDAAAQELGNDFAEMVVVMLTTSLNPADRERAEAFGMVKDFISKPLTIAHLQEIAETILAKES